MHMDKQSRTHRDNKCSKDEIPLLLTLLYQQDRHSDQQSPVHRILHVYRSAVCLLCDAVWRKIACESLENPEKCFFFKSTSPPGPVCL